MAEGRLRLQSESAQRSAPRTKERSHGKAESESVWLQRGFLWLRGSAPGALPLRRGLRVPSALPMCRLRLQGEEVARVRGRR
jgi:hypothetical protein